ncbi:MAG TPA: 1-deoxy-D-xylulose-5-phosphate reductoisomerase, partial [Acidimicrobiia bacterium]|nr:1-deoxy-D-xylulose-5-phosphate reductoisomerase [Acidimicrobiia bacterium]
AVVAVADAQARREVADALEPLGIEIVGDLAAVVDRADVVINGVVGFAGLGVTLASLEAGKRLALANKESLIAAGPVVQRVRSTPGAELERVTVADALAHPTWSMGPKITVDSSTLMNKGLEVIEARELFDVELERIEVVVHPQSVIHGMVEFSDGSTIAQLSMPDMRLPIAYALAAPGRVGQAVGVIDWARLGTLSFEVPDLDAFPCLGLAYRAARAGGDAPATLNAANEVAVAAFLDGRLPWRGIADVVGEVLEGHSPGKVTTIEDVVESDGRARRCAAAAVDRRNAA